MNHKTPILQSAVALAQAESKRDAERRTIAEGASMAIMATPIAEIVQILGNIHIDQTDPEHVKLTIQSPGASRAYALQLPVAFILSLAEQLEARAATAAAESESSEGDTQSAPDAETLELFEAA